MNALLQGWPQRGPHTSLMWLALVFRKTIILRPVTCTRGWPWTVFYSIFLIKETHEQQTGQLYVNIHKKPATKKICIFFMFCWPCILIIFVMETNLMHYLSLIYFINQPLHVSGIFIAHRQEVFTVYVQQLVRVIRLGDWLLTSSQSLERTIRTNCCTYTVNTSWWWAINMPETCRGWLTK
jgi:hypothetical protein